MFYYYYFWHREPHTCLCGADRRSLPRWQRCYNLLYNKHIFQAFQPALASLWAGTRAKQCITSHRLTLAWLSAEQEHPNPGVDLLCGRCYGFPACGYTEATEGRGDKNPLTNTAKQPTNNFKKRAFKAFTRHKCFFVCDKFEKKTAECKPFYFFKYCGSTFLNFCTLIKRIKQLNLFGRADAKSVSHNINKKQSLANEPRII